MIACLHSCGSLGWVLGPQADLGGLWPDAVRGLGVIADAVSGDIGRVAGLLTEVGGAASPQLFRYIEVAEVNEGGVRIATAVIFAADGHAFDHILAAEGRNRGCGGRAGERWL